MEQGKLFRLADVSRTAVSILVVIGVMLKYSACRGSLNLLFSATALVNFPVTIYLL